MQETLVPNRPNLTVAEKAGQAKWPQLLLDHLGVVVGFAKQALAPAVATAEATPINGNIFQPGFGSPQQLIHVLGRRRCRAALELNGLPQARQSANRNAAGTGVSSEQIANQEVTAMELLSIFIDHQADEQIAARFFLFLWRKLVKGFCQHFVGRAVAYFVDDIRHDFGLGPGFNDRGAALRSHSN